MLATGVPVIDAIFTRQVERGIGRTAGKHGCGFLVRNSGNVSSSFPLKPSTYLLDNSAVRATLDFEFASAFRFIASLG